MIPDYQTLMRPLLECIQDGQEHLFKNVIEQLADRFELTQEEREQLAPSGHRALFSGRVGWAKTYLKKAGLLEQRKRGILSITSRGTARTEKKRDTLDHLSGNKGFKIQKENRRNLPDGIPEFRRFLRPVVPQRQDAGKRVRACYRSGMHASSHSGRDDRPRLRTDTQ